MSISKLTERFSNTQKRFFIGFLGLLFLVLWFTFISIIETKISNSDESNVTITSFDASLCIDQNPQLEICQLRLDALDLIKTFKEIKKNALATNVGIWAPDDLNSLVGTPSLES